MVLNFSPILGYVYDTCDSDLQLYVRVYNHI